MAAVTAYPRRGRVRRPTDREKSLKRLIGGSTDSDLFRVVLFRLELISRRHGFFA